MKREPIVTLEAVSKRYPGGTLALDGLTLAIEEGDFVAFLGPSGCGKSTLLRLIAGLTPPSAGHLFSPATGRNGGRLSIGFVFQEPTLMPWATALGNVVLPLRLAGLGRGEAAARAAEALVRVGLEGFEHAVPRALSGGMRMRVSIARALVTRPRVLLMDEPFAALDEITRSRLNDDLVALWAEERFTVLFVTHSVFESVYLARRIVVMAARPGRVFSEIEVRAPPLRDLSFRTSAEYAAQCREVSGGLALAMAA